VPDAARDARILLAAALEIDRARLTLVVPDPLTPAAAARFEQMVVAREKRQPVSQILGQREFYGRQFVVTSDVLDPRPDTELLIDVALKSPFDTVLDLGTGTGCILLTLLAETAATGLASDVSAAALGVAQGNAAALGLDQRARFVLSNWFAKIPAQRFDLIVSNPPYISEQAMKSLSPEVQNWEPHLALTPGGDGLTPYQILTESAASFLTTDGRLIVEIGYDQGPQVAAMFENSGFEDVEIATDLSGHNRVVSGRFAG
jgi:release factor glutamine methyltransferase